MKPKVSIGRAAHLKIDVGFVFFGSCTLAHLERSWWTLCHQTDTTRIRRVYFLNNNTPFALSQVEKIILSPKPPFPVAIEHAKHNGDKTHSWTVNHICRDWMPRDTDWIFWTRSDYLLDNDCLRAFAVGAEQILRVQPERKLFVTSDCHLIGYNFANGTPVNGGDPFSKDQKKKIDLDQIPWRENGGARYLLGRVPGYEYKKTAGDAGVWLTRRAYLAEAGWMNESMKAWGFQQSIFQNLMKLRAGVTFMVTNDFLHHHQEHPVKRSFTQAKKEAESAYPTITADGPGWSGYFE